MFFEKLCKNPENYPGGLPSESQSKIIFDMLLDREVHTKEELVKAAGYAGTDNKKFRNLMKRLEAIKVVDKSGGKSIQLNGTMFGATVAATVPSRFEEDSEPPKKKAKTEDTKVAKKMAVNTKKSC
jgi:hypothetical protein